MTRNRCGGGEKLGEMVDRTATGSRRDSLSRTANQSAALPPTDTFHSRYSDLTTQEKAQVEFITLMMAAFHLAELVPELHPDVNGVTPALVLLS